MNRLYLSFLVLLLMVGFSLTLRSDHTGSSVESASVALEELAGGESMRLPQPCTALGLVPEPDGEPITAREQYAFAAQAATAESDADHKCSWSLRGPPAC